MSESNPTPHSPLPKESHSPLPKRALITGITGQDGAYLAEFLLGKGYEVHGIKRRASLFNTDRIDHLYKGADAKDNRFFLHHGDLTDSSSLIRIIKEVQPDEIYNLAAQSHVAVSFEEPEYTANSDALGTLRILEAIRILGLEKKTRFYQASTSELFGKVQEIPQKETTPFYPRSPYAVAKLYAYWITVNYRESYGMYACNGILFNHECISADSPLIVRSGALVNVVTPGELVPLRRKGESVQHFAVPSLEIWDGQDWTTVKGITATRRRAKSKDHALLSIEARGGVVACTAHHTMIKADNSECRADALSEGGNLLTTDTFPQTPEWTILTEEMAEFLGLMVADGYIPSAKRTVVQFTNNSAELQKRVSELWSRLFLGNGRVTQGTSGFGEQSVGQGYFSGAGSSVVRWLRELIYAENGYKRVPAIILNASRKIQTAFLAGSYAGDGLKAGNGESIKTNSPLLAQGLYWLYANNGQLASVYVERRNGRSYYQLNIGTASPMGKKGQHLRKPAEEIRRIGSASCINDEWVFDLETESEKFLCGVGRVIVHNSPIRGETFVTRKITRALARIALGLQECVHLGNMDAKRDWGHAKDYVEMQWLMLQQEQPEDFVIATGEQYSVRDFVNAAAEELGIKMRWEGKGVEEVGYIDSITHSPLPTTQGSNPTPHYPLPKAGTPIVRVSQRFFRPAEVETLLGDPANAKAKLGWTPRITFKELVAEMMREDMKAAQRDELVKSHGYTVHDFHE